MRCFGKVVRRLHDVAIRHPDDLQVHVLDPAEQQKVREAGGGGGVELAGLRFRQRHQLIDRIDIHRCRHRDREHDGGDADDRQQVAFGVVRQRVVIVGRHRQDAGRPEPQRMIVGGVDKGLDRHDAVAARAILDHHRLAPARRQAIGEQPGGDVAGAGGAEWHDEFDGAGRISLLRHRTVGEMQAGGDRQAGNCHKSSHRHPPRETIAAYNSSSTRFSRKLFRDISQPANARHESCKDRDLRF